MRGKELAEEELRKKNQEEVPESYYENIEKALNI